MSSSTKYLVLMRFPKESFFVSTEGSKGWGHREKSEKLKRGLFKELKLRNLNFAVDSGIWREIGLFMGLCCHPTLARSRLRAPETFFYEERRALFYPHLLHLSHQFTVGTIRKNNNCSGIRGEDISWRNRL